MSNRLQRLEYALCILPYHHKMVEFSASQKKVEEILSKLCTDEPTGSELSDEEQTRLQEIKAEGFAEQTLQQIEDIDMEHKAPKNNQQLLSTLETLTKAAEKLKTIEVVDSGDEGDDFDFETSDFMDVATAVAQVDRKELMDNNILALNEARLKMLQRWERSKLKALDVLMIEIGKVQSRSDQPTTLKMEEDTGDLNTSATDNEDYGENESLEVEVDDEEYSPPSNGATGKRKRSKKRGKASKYFEPNCPPLEFDRDPTSTLVTIGPNGTQVTRRFLRKTNWLNSGPATTRKLLCEIFKRKMLAFYTLSGKPSPAFKDCARPPKQKLTPSKVADLVYLMSTTKEMTAREVRTAITTKCADENKMLRTRILSDRAKGKISEEKALAFLAAEKPCPEMYRRYYELAEKKKAAKKLRNIRNRKRA